MERFCQGRMRYLWAVLCVRCHVRIIFAGRRGRQGGAKLYTRWRRGGEMSAVLPRNSGRIVEDHMSTVVTHAISSLQATQASGYKYWATYSAYEKIIPLYAATASNWLNTLRVNFSVPSARANRHFLFSTKQVGNRPTTKYNAH